MISVDFEEFSEIIDGIKNEIEFQEGIEELVRGVHGEYYRETSCVYYTISLLNKIFRDDDDYPLIDYWIYDLDFGKRWKEGSVTHNGSDVKLETVSDLYDALTKQMVEKRGE